MGDAPAVTGTVGEPGSFSGARVAVGRGVGVDPENRLGEIFMKAASRTKIPPTIAASTASLVWFLPERLICLTLGAITLVPQYLCYTARIEL
jgi:hypothetical protein